MPHGDHGHHHHHGQSRKNLLVALGLNLSFAVIEFFGGLWTGSVAILSDAVHDLGDSLALASAYFMERRADKGSDERFSYGYRRMSLLSALFTNSFLIVGSLWVLSEAIPRLFNPSQPMIGGMIGFAILGIAVNGYAAWRTQHGETLNEKAVSWHMIEDVLGWVGVLIGSLVMLVWDVPIVDPILSILFTLYILVNVVKSLRRTMHLFLQGVPAGVDLAAMRGQINELVGVIDNHDLHIWSLDGASHVLTLHLLVEKDQSVEKIQSLKQEVRKIVGTYGEIHPTIEVELEGEECFHRDCGNGGTV